MTCDRQIGPFDCCSVVQGDCLELMKQIPDGAVDAVITDPPYSRDVYQRLRSPNTHKGSGTPARMGIRNHQYSSISIEKLAAGAIGHVDEMFEPCGVEVSRITRRWGLVFSDAESTHRWRFSLEDAGMRYVRTGAWVKPDGMPQFSGDRPAVGFEPCTIVHARGAMRWNGGGGYAVWNHSTCKGDARPDHPCPKPEPLMLELIGLFSDDADTILDPFCGSGTTLVAAKKLGRHFLGFEISADYCAIARRRLDEIDAQPNLFTPKPEQLEFEP